MKTSPCLYLLTCLAMAFLEGAFHGAYAEEQPVKYIFELSDEPVKVRPGKIDTKSVFFPKYARGTSPEALKRQAAIFQTPAEQEAPENKVSINIHMNSDRADADGGGLTGYEFNHSNTQEGMIITTETRTAPSSTRPVPQPIRKSGKYRLRRTFGRPGMKKK